MNREEFNRICNYANGYFNRKLGTSHSLVDFTSLLSNADTLTKKSFKEAGGISYWDWEDDSCEYESTFLSVCFNKNRTEEDVVRIILHEKYHLMNRSMSEKEVEQRAEQFAEGHIREYFSRKSR